jgi:short-subunit dehydrogenase
VSDLPVVLVLGGTSGIGRAVAAAFARRGYQPIVTGRRPDEAARAAEDLAIRCGVPCRGMAFDAARFSTHQAFFDQVVEAAGDRLAGVVAAFGVLGDQRALQDDAAGATDLVAVNFTGLVSILTIAANWLERQGAGFIVGIGSVAGDRGRQSNYLYGSTKAAVAVFLAGLRNRLHNSGIRVLTVKPGFVDTEMTFGAPGLFLVADPADIGERIVRAVERRRDVVYLPGFWRFVMALIKLVPERLFKRLRL